MFVNRHTNRRENTWEEPQASNSNKVNHYVKFKPGNRKLPVRFIFPQIKNKTKIIKIKCSQTELDLRSRDF